MSYQIGLDTLHLKQTERIAHTEYCSSEPIRRALCDESGVAFEDALELDLIWNTNDGPVKWGEVGRVTDMGHAEFLEHGSDKRQPKPCPFTEVEQVLEFDAVKEYGVPDQDSLIDFYEQRYQEGQQEHPNQLVTGGYYRTMISGAIDTFGWDMLLMAAADEEAFEKVIDSYFRLSLHYYQAWAKTSIEAFIAHDDMVWTQGAFMNPSFYRRVLFPRYKELWAVLKQAGKKVLFCSDGNWDAFVDDIAACGADGFIFEPVMDLNAICSRYGQSHVLIGSKVDCRTLTFGPLEAIQDELDRTLPHAHACPGFIWAVGNHIPSNVPLEHFFFYRDYLKQHWKSQ